MALGIRAIRDKLVDHALSSWQFEAVNSHVPKATPNTGVVAVVEFDRLVPARTSGLASVSMVVVFEVSIYLSLDQEPADDIDIRAVEAADALFSAYVGDFELGGNVRCVDVFGSEGAAGGEGAGLAARAGYARVGEAEVRAVTLTVPLVVNDVYTETA